MHKRAREFDEFSLITNLRYILVFFKHENDLSVEKLKQQYILKAMLTLRNSSSKFWLQINVNKLLKLGFFISHILNITFAMYAYVFLCECIFIN